eukprot:jgi/Psemu1/53568/gm1.53568_g
MPHMVNKIEADEVIARLVSKSQNDNKTSLTKCHQIREAEKVLGNLNNASSYSEKISNNCAAAITKLSDCTALLEQLKQQMMRVKEDVIEPLQHIINSAKKRDDSNESDEDLNKKPKSKPKSQKPNNFPKARSPAYMKNESQNFTKHCCFNLEPGVAVMKLSNHVWKYDTSFPACLMSNKESLRKVPNAIICIHALYRSMIADREPEEQTEEMITKIMKTYADIVRLDSGIDYFMLQFPKMKKLSIDFCGLITSQPGEGAFKHNPKSNAITVFLLKDEVNRFHYVLVNGLQSLILFMYNWEGKYFGKNVLEPALKRKYDEVICVLAPHIMNKRKLGNQPLPMFVGAWQIERETRIDLV